MTDWMLITERPWDFLSQDKETPKETYITKIQEKSVKDIRDSFLKVEKKRFKKKEQLQQNRQSLCKNFDMTSLLDIPELQDMTIESIGEHMWHNGALIIKSRTKFAGDLYTFLSEKSLPNVKIKRRDDAKNMVAVFFKDYRIDIFIRQEKLSS